MGQSKEIGRAVDMADLGKRDMRAQFAALPWRKRDDRIEICMITSRDTGRWVIPKGWPMHGRTPQQAASVEAFEEAGLEGVISERCAGIFTYLKEMDGGHLLPVVVSIFPLEVSRQLGDWPEADQRTRKWMTLKKAAKLASDAELRRILADPHLTRILR